MKKRYASRTNEHSSDDSQINLTPLIDVVFVVLIMFILVAPLMDMDRVELASAPKNEKKQPQVQESSPIKISVSADNAILFNSQVVTLEQLLNLLKAAKQKGPRQIPQLFQDRRSQFGVYQTVKNIVEQAGFDELDVILKPS